MHITTSPLFRRFCGWTAVTGWAVSAALTATLVVIGRHYSLHMLLLFCLAVAITTTVTGLVGDSLAPVEATYRHVYNAGVADGVRQGRPVLVPESRMQDMREIKLDAS